jgi:biotin carboxyl carrier protein
MKRSISIRDESFQVEVDGDPSAGFTLRVEEAEHEVIVRGSEAHRHELVVDGRNEALITARDGEGTWVWAAGRSWYVLEPDASPGRRRKKVGTGGNITPTTPGVVARILVSVGECVDKGQELVVVSAMKMEMPLVAASPGVVTAIATEVGANVRPGDVLVEIEKDEAEESSDE